MFYYLSIFIATFLLSIIFTYCVKFFAVRLNIIDKPEIERKIHKINTPLFGGAAIFLAFFIILYFARAKLLAGDLESHHWLGFFVGACFLMIGGFLDDKYNLSPKVQIIFPLFAIFSVIAGGVGIDKITNPLGGLISLGQLQIPIMAWGGSYPLFYGYSRYFYCSVADGHDVYH